MITLNSWKAQKKTENKVYALLVGKKNCWIVCQFITSNSNLVCFKTVRHSIPFPITDSSRRSISLYPWNRSSGGVSKPYYYSKSQSMAHLKEKSFFRYWQTTTNNKMNSKQPNRYKKNKKCQQPRRRNRFGYQHSNLNMFICQ